MGCRSCLQRPLPAGLALLLVACGSGPFSQSEALSLRQAEERWSATAPSHYTLEMRRLCFCGPDVTEWATIEVDHDSLVAVTLLTGDSVPHSAWYARPPVPQLFRDLHNYRPSWLDDVRAEYDTANGYPSRIVFTSDNSVTDAGLIIEARELTPIAP